MAEAQKATADINEARLLIVPPPLIQGIGSAGGYPHDGRRTAAAQATARSARRR